MIRLEPPLIVEQEHVDILVDSLDDLLARDFARIAMTTSAQSSSPPAIDHSSAGRVTVAYTWRDGAVRCGTLEGLIRMAWLGAFALLGLALLALDVCASESATAACGAEAELGLEMCHGRDSGVASDPWTGVGCLAVLVGVRCGCVVSGGESAATEKLNELPKTTTSSSSTTMPPTTTTLDPGRPPSRSASPWSTPPA